MTESLADRWRVRMAPEASLGAPVITSGLVSRVRPVEISAQPLARAARAIGVRGEPTFDGEDEWSITDDRGYVLALGAGLDPHFPAIAGRQIRRAKPPEGWPPLEPVEAWAPGGAEAERLASAAAMVRRMGIDHLTWVSPGQADGGRGIRLRPEVDGLPVGNVAHGAADYWSIWPAKAGTGLDRLRGRMADIEPVATLPVRDPRATFDRLLVGDWLEADLVSASMDPGAQRWVDGVHMELAERRYKAADGQVTVYLVPVHVFTGSMAAAGAPREPFPGVAGWPSLGGLVAVPAVDFEPPEPSVLV